jgi:polysaccharide biosynthesis protein PslA
LSEDFPLRDRHTTAPFAGVEGFIRHHFAKYRSSQPTTSLAKRSFDIFAATLGLLLLSPCLLVVALAIKLTSRGPVLFRQRRYGLNNAIFVIYKFRTMYIDIGDETGVKQTCGADRRVTPIGKVLRRWSLDELPQLLNIVKGDMSLVGPRPHVPGMLALCRITSSATASSQD